MTRIEQIDVDGFKGLTDTSLEFGGINVITGRNNTGKTSVLEAIELGLDPERLERYGVQVDNLINVRGQKCDIELSHSSGQCSLSVEFAPAEEALDNVIEAFVRAASSFGSHQGVPEDMELSKAIERVLRTELADAETGEVPEIERNVLYVSYNGGSFQLFNVNRQISPLFENRIKRIQASLESKIDLNKVLE